MLTATPGNPPGTATFMPTPSPVTGIETLGVPGRYQPHGSHARITDLQTWQGRIYIGHGDWVENTGPVRALAYDPAAGSLTWDENFSFAEEQVEVFRPGDGGLLVPGGDGQESWEFGSLYLHQAGAAWRQLRSLPGGVHVWDVVVIGDDWAAVGSGPAGEGRIWLSFNGGADWTLDAQGARLLGADADNPLNTHAGLFQLNGHIYLSAQAGCFVLQGSAWVSAEGCNLAGRTVYKSVAWGSGMALVPYASRLPEAAAFLLFYDGTATQTFDFRQSVLDVTTLDGKLLVLASPAAGRANIYAASTPGEGFNLLWGLDLPVLDPMKPSPAWPLALEALDGYLYLGLQDGQLLRYDVR